MQKGDNCLGLLKSLEHVDRGSVHVVEHNDDLFSWKEYSNYKHVHTSSSKIKKSVRGNFA
jgi:hypothetical protein